METLFLFGGVMLVVIVAFLIFRAAIDRSW